MNDVRSGVIVARHLPTASEVMSIADLLI